MQSLVTELKTKKKGMLKTYIMAIIFLFGYSSASSKRFVHIQDKKFILRSNNQPILLSGPNVVVKGPPYLPEVSGDTYCIDNTDGDCSQTGTCTSCTTFNQADIDHIKSMGWNTIRLGVIWAGA